MNNARMRFIGKHIMITGAARGIGFEIARHFGNEGGVLSLVDNNRENLVEDTHGPVLVAQVDDPLQIALLRKHHADVLEDGFSEYAGDGIFFITYSIDSRSLKFTMCMNCLVDSGMPADKGMNSYSPGEILGPICSREGMTARLTSLCHPL